MVAVPFVHPEGDVTNDREVTGQEQAAALAEFRNTQLAPGTQQALMECRWKGGGRHSAANFVQCGGEALFFGAIEGGMSL
jgi:hypothetical protein